jgi:hypothetical protein
MTTINPCKIRTYENPGRTENPCVGGSGSAAV